MKKRVHIIFFGDVYGTGYRFFIKQKAIDLGLKGYCHLNDKNEIVVDVEGKSNSIDEFLHFIEKGVSPQSGYNGFQVEILTELKGYSSMESDLV